MQFSLTLMPSFDQAQQAASSAPPYQSARHQVAVGQARAGLEEAQRVLMLVQSEVWNAEEDAAKFIALLFHGCTFPGSQLSG